MTDLPRFRTDEPVGADPARPTIENLEPKFAVEYACGCVGEWGVVNGWTGLWITSLCEAHKMPQPEEKANA